MKRLKSELEQYSNVYEFRNIGETTVKASLIEGIE